MGPKKVLNKILFEFCIFLCREKAEAVMKGVQPLSQVGRPEDIGRAVAFLADETKSGFATGTDINIDGGYKLVPKSA